MEIFNVLVNIKNSFKIKGVASFIPMLIATWTDFSTTQYVGYKS